MTSKPDIAAMYGASPVDTFLGLPACRDIGALSHPIAIIGIPCATPYPRVGAYCSEGPAAIRAAMAPYASNLTHFDFALGGQLFPGGRALAADCGDLQVRDSDPAGNRQTIRRTVETVLARGVVPVVIGGDNSVPIPVFEAYEGRGPFAILQIDAHIDWRDEVGGERLGLSSVMRRASEMAHIGRMIQVGQRGVGSARPADRADALKRGVEFISGREVQNGGIARAISLVPEGAEVIIAFDWDGLDPSIMPSVIGRAPGGLSYWQVFELIAGVAAKARIAGAALVEFMPQRDVDGIGGLTAGRLTADILGIIARQVAPAG